MNSLIPFKFENRDVRAVVIDGAEWWVGRDVAEALGFKDTVNAIKQHCRGVAKHHPIVDSLGRTQEARIINEGDVFRLMAGSRLPRAMRFEKWLFEEVLPQIRKTGAYVPDEALQNIKDLQGRVLELELNRSVTEKMLLRAQRTIERFENRNFLSSEDKREILTLYFKKYPISAIQRITKKGRTRIANFINEVAYGDEEAVDSMFAEWKREDEFSESFRRPPERPRGHDGGAV